MWEPVDQPRAQSHQQHQLVHPLVAPLRRIAQLVNPDGFADDGTYRPARVKRGVGILEDHLGFAPQVEQLLSVRLMNLDAGYMHLAARAGVKRPDGPPPTRLTEPPH